MKRIVALALLALTSALGHAATFTITNTNDSGPGSLRQAILDSDATAPGPNDIKNVINFDPGVTGTIQLTSGTLRIQKNPVAIVGPGADKLTIDGNYKGMIFLVLEPNGSYMNVCPNKTGPVDIAVYISGLTLQHGKTASDSKGGAVQSVHSLALDSLTIQDNSARAGGGVAMFTQWPGQTLTINRVNFYRNKAEQTGYQLSSNIGGGVVIAENCPPPTYSTAYTAGTSAYITNAVFSGNTSNPIDWSGIGGAIGANAPLLSLTISDSRIEGNHIYVPSTPVSGMSYRGGGIWANVNSLTIERSEISDNSVEGTTVDVPRGGGISVQNTDATLQGAADTTMARVVNSTISGNRSSTTAGAMFVMGNVALTLDNSTVAENRSDPTRAGGIFVSKATSGGVTPTLTLVSSILANNSNNRDVATNTLITDPFTISATNSLIGGLCPVPNCTTISVAGSGNMLGVDPMLGPLADNGGPTRTHALLPGSPAIDAGYAPDLATDQRGFARPEGGAPDIGAFELVDTSPPQVTCGFPDGLWHGGDVSIACTATDAESGLDVPTYAAFDLTTSIAADTETANAATNSRSVCNTLGACTNAGPIGGNKVDRKAPSITISVPADGGTYQRGATIGASYACTDGGAGVASCTGTVANASPVDTSTTGTMSFTVSSTDRVGNASSAVVSYSVVNGGGGGQDSADVGISLLAPSRVSPGGTLTYSMTVTNAGKLTATGVSVADTLPAGTVFASASASQGTVATPAPGANGTVTANLGSIANGGSATISITVTVTAVPGTVLLDAASVTATTQDVNNANNSATQKTTVTKK